MKIRRGSSGFTIIELLVVIVVIAILAAVTIVAFRGIQDRARLSRMQKDISELRTAALMARESTGKTIFGMTNNGYGTGGSAAACSNVHPAGTDMAALPKTDNCWVSYNKFLDVVSTASGKDVRGITDPWGRPYVILEWESATNCRTDEISAMSYPYNMWGRTANTAVTVPRMTPGVGC